MPKSPPSRLPPIIRRLFPWVVIDLPLVWVCYALALVVRGVTADLEYEPALLFGALASLIVVLCNEGFGIYRRWWRYATSQDVVPLATSVTIATVAIVGLDLAWPVYRPMPLGAVVLGSFFALFALTAVRYRTKPLDAVRRTWRRLVTAPGSETTRVLIVGAGDAGQLLGWQLHYGPQADRHHVVGFVDDDPRKHGMLIHGRKVWGDRSQIPRLVTAHDVDLIVLAIHHISGHDFREIVGACQETMAQIKVLPNVLGSIGGDDALATGGSLFGDVTLEDLLGRHSVAIDRDQCRHLVRGKTVLVTGASGSIGAELCRQLADLRPARLLMLDTNESGLHDLSVELQGYRSDDTVLVPIIADVTREAKLRSIFAAERPTIVFHTAAYKHVPLMEEFPEEAVRVNVGGTRLAMELADEYGAERFVLVSSDKAVEPSSVMGATKRVCELLGSTMPADRTRFTAVRFGNVLASRGSVVPTFDKQIDLGGPVTITDPAMARYFMSLSEASSLIIQAASFTEGGDVFILDMGEEINVADLARRMIRMRGLRPDIDIPIVITGPRPGEKLREILASSSEKLVSTPHPQVVRVQGGTLPCPPSQLVGAVSQLLFTAQDGDREAVRAHLWRLARDGAAPPTLPVSSLAATRSASVALASGNQYGLPAASVRPRVDDRHGPPLGGIAAPRDRPMQAAPLRILADRASENLAGVGDRVLALEPYYVLPSVLVLLAYPNSLVGAALMLIGAPWLVRWARTGRPIPSTPFNLPLGLFVIGAGIGLFATTSTTWAGIRMAGLLAGVALFYLIVNQATTVHRLARTLQIVFFVTGVGSLLLLVLAAPYLPLASILDGWVPWQTLVAGTDDWRRATIGSEEALQRYRFRASGVGAVATFGLALAAGPLLGGARRSTRMIGLAMSVLFVIVVALSGHRGSMVSVAVLGVALLGLRSGWFLAAVPVVLIGLWGALERGWFGAPPADAQSLAVKMTFWRNASSLLHDYALTGAGLGLRSVRDIYEAYFLPIGPGFSHAHNVFVQAYLEQGVLGVLGLVGLAASLFFYGRRAVATARGPLAWGTSLAAAGAAMVLFFEGLTEVVLLTSGGTALLLVALGLLVAASRLDERRSHVGARSRLAERWVQLRESQVAVRPSVATPLAIGLAVALGSAVLLSPLGAILYLNLGAIERSRAVLQDGTSREERDRRLASAESLLRSGLDVGERDPALWRNLAEVAIARGDSVEARMLLRRARERTAPDDGYGLFQLGRLHRDSGATGDAIRAWREAGAGTALLAWGVELRARRQWDRGTAVLLAAAEELPNDSEAHRQYAQVARNAAGGSDNALQELNRLATLHPLSPWPHVELARLYEELGRQTDAAAARSRAASLGVS